MRNTNEPRQNSGPESPKRFAPSAEKLDFILNYDTHLRQGFGGHVKYRLRRDTEGEEE